MKSIFKKTSRVLAHIHGSMRQHSKHQLEIDCDLKLGTEATAKLHCHTLMLFPKQFAVDIREREHVYNAMASMIRFRQPKQSGKRLIKDEDYGLSGLRQGLEAFAGEVNPPPAVGDRIVRRTRIYGATFFDFVRRKQEKLADLLEDQRNHAAPDPPFLTELAKTVKRCRKSLHQYSQMLNQTEFQTNQKPVQQELQDVMEFCYYAYADMLQEVLGLASRHGWLEGSSAMPDLVSEEIKALKAAYDRHSFIWLSKNSSTREKEQAVNRRRYLKRKVMSELYLDTSDIRRFWVEEHFGGMLAASLAAVWATTIHLALLTSGNNLMVMEVGTSTLVVFTAVVLAYVLKDRIKDQGKKFFRSLFSQVLADRIWKVSGRATDERMATKPILKIFEKVEFHHPDEALSEYALMLPEDIDQRALAKEGITLRQTFSFQRRMRHEDFRQLRQIVRINVDRFLGRLDDSEVRLFELTEAGDVAKLSLPKRYYGYCIVSTRNAKTPIWETTAFQIAFSKRGIDRVEPISLTTPTHR